MTINESTLEFLKEKFEHSVMNFVLDPGEVCGGNTTDMKFLYDNLCLIGEDIGTPFWTVAEAECDESDIYFFKKALGIK